MSTKPNISFNPVPSLSTTPAVSVQDTPKGGVASIRFVHPDHPLPVEGTGWDALKAAGFDGKKNETFTLALEAPLVLVGLGDANISVASLREAAAAGAASTSKAATVELTVPAEELLENIPVEEAAEALAEGVLLTRYLYTPLKTDSDAVPLTDLTLVADSAVLDSVRSAAEKARILSRTTNLARDLANTPPRHLNAEDFARTIVTVAPNFGLTTEVFDMDDLTELELGGLLGVNSGSVAEARMVKLSYSPSEPTGRLGLVGKGVMYDSGGISLKPSDPMHALMKFDMSGAASVFAAMTALKDLGSETEVTGWLMCTDNMPSGSATKLGDVLTIRGGKTVEVKNTDAEGRLVLADGLVLATEEEPRVDAIVDIATLTGAALMALGARTAAMFSNEAWLAEQVEAAAEQTDETVWQLPLDTRYKDQLKSDVADYSNIGSRFGGAILAALFLSEFVDDRPWAHLDIAGTMNSEKNDFWRITGSTGFGARLLATLATNFEVPATS